MTAQNSENVKAWQVYAYEGGAVGILAGDTFIASMATGSDAASNAARVDILEGDDMFPSSALLAEARALLLNGGA
jgi:hypothetical protein